MQVQASGGSEGGSTRPSSGNSQQPKPPQNAEQPALALPLPRSPMRRMDWPEANPGASNTALRSTASPSKHDSATKWELMPPSTTPPAASPPRAKVSRQETSAEPVVVRNYFLSRRVGTLYSFWDSITPYRTDCLHFFGPMNSATNFLKQKHKFRPVADLGRQARRPFRWRLFEFSGKPQMPQRERTCRHHPCHMAALGNRQFEPEALSCSIR